MQITVDGAMKYCSNSSMALKPSWSEAEKVNVSTMELKKPRIVITKKKRRRVVKYKVWLSWT